jgi:hypothetical protein
MAVERAPELEELAREWEAMHRRKDFAGVRSSLSASDCFLSIGTDPGEIWESRDAVMPEMQQMVESAESGGLDAEMGAPRAYRDGDVGWIVGLDGAFKLPDGTAIPVRSVVIVHREGEEWKAVFSMAAIPVPNVALDDPGSTLTRELAATHA